MKTFKSFLLLILMGIILFPREMVCMTHPLGHNHQHEGPSPCELRQQYKGKGDALWPPMDCKKMLTAIEQFDIQDVQKTATSVQLIVVAVLLDIINPDNNRQPDLPSPYPNCRSATCYSDSPLRAPPLV